MGHPEVSVRPSTSCQSASILLIAYPVKLNDKDLRDCTREELLKILEQLHAEVERKAIRLNALQMKFNRARLVVRSQQVLLRRLRQRIVELTPASGQVFRS